FSETFREDLYYRICEIEIPIPPLRERENGVLMLARVLLNEAAERHGKSILIYCRHWTTWLQPLKLSPKLSVIS
ncbi:MAG: hypothetical protein AAFW66_06950, partial [Pseudomonadota bacterium]